MFIRKVLVGLVAAGLISACANKDGSLDSTSDADLEAQASKTALESEESEDSGGIGEELGLTAEQLEALQKIRAAHREAAKALIEAARESGDQESLREKLAALREAHREALASILTEEQIAKLAEIKASFDGRGHRRAGGGDRVAVLQEKLGLSDAQVEALGTLLADQREALQAVREAAKESGDREAAKAELAALKEKFDADFSAILDEDQNAAYEELKSAAQDKVRRGKRGRRRFGRGR